MANHAPSLPGLAPARQRSRSHEPTTADQEDRKVQLLLGSLALGSIALSVLSYLHPFG
jgi:hypothetical protein